MFGDCDSRKARLFDQLSVPSMEGGGVYRITDPIEEMLIEVLTPSEFDTLGFMLYMSILETVCPILNPDDLSPESIFRTKHHLRSNYCLIRDEISICLVTKVVREEIYEQGFGNKYDTEKELRAAAADTMDMPDCFSTCGERPTLTSTISTAGISNSISMMSGARSEDCQLPALQYSHLNAVVCTDDMVSQIKHQPFRIIQMQELQTYDILENIQNWDVLGDDFLITPFGLSQALTGASRSQGSTDSAIIEALLMRGGRVPASMELQQVIYPEDLVPFIYDHRIPIDEQYWELMLAQGRIWDEI